MKKCILPWILVLALTAAGLSGCAAGPAPAQSPAASAPEVPAAPPAPASEPEHLDAEELSPVTVQSLGLEDGDYTVEVVLSGGSGRASVASPARMTVQEGQALVTLVWNSSNYDYMRLEETRYDPVESQGGSTFQIPLPWFDAPAAVYADTVAMSTPHEIEYELTFSSASVKGET